MICNIGCVDLLTMGLTATGSVIPAVEFCEGVAIVGVEPGNAVLLALVEDWHAVNETSASERATTTEK